jgi:hypothetical protein
MMGMVVRQCRCEPPIAQAEDEHGRLSPACPTCGSVAVVGSFGELPDFIRDTTPYVVSVVLSPALLKSHLPLLKRKTGLSTPRLLEMAKQGERLVLPKEQFRPLHYTLQEYLREQLQVDVVPPYPHSLD